VGDAVSLTSLDGSPDPAAQEKRSVSSASGDRSRLRTTPATASPTGTCCHRIIT